MKRVANIVECPRDAMQGIKEFIETEKKIAYIQKLLNCGFHTLDFGSFVSPKAIPQMADTKEVLSNIDLSGTDTKLLAIVANERGIEDASQYSTITYLGFPLSISETFQRRNTNAGIDDAIKTVDFLAKVCKQQNKIPVVYISMGFGNPYGDEWNTDIVKRYADILVEAQIPIISLADTMGLADASSIQYIFQDLIPKYPDITFGAHFHTTPFAWKEKIEAAWNSGCNRFDGAIKGFGGCPMAADALTGNMPTEKMLAYFDTLTIETGIDREQFLEAMGMATSIFPEVH